MQYEHGDYIERPTNRPKAVYADGNVTATFIATSTPREPQWKFSKILGVFQFLSSTDY